MTAKKPYLEDLEFVSDYLSGDNLAEKALYKMIRKLIEGLIAQLSRKGSIFRDKDNVTFQIIYEVMIKDDKKVMRNYQGNSKLSTYLYPVVRNKLIDAVRKERRYHDRIVTNDIADDVPDANPNAVSEIEVLIEEHIRLESPQNQFVKYSRWMREMSYREISKEFEKKFGQGKTINVQQISYVLTLNRKSLQKKLIKHGALKRHK